MKVFDPSELNKLCKPHPESSGEDNGQVTIIGGSKLFHGAPILALKAASRLVDMVFFASPDESVGKVAERIKSKLMSFIWVPWEEVDAYIEKSDAILIGPGLMRYTHEQKKLKVEELRNFENNVDGKLTKDITERLLKKYSNKKWVIDAGSLQTMDAEWIPKGAILTPNAKEFKLLFGQEFEFRGQSFDYIEDKLTSNLKYLTSRYNCTIVLKGPETFVCSPDECAVVRGGNPGLTKGGTGDVLAGLTVALLAKNNAFLSAASASYIEKAAADELYRKTGVNYNADDLADQIPKAFGKIISKD